jgi:hypothetical protein
LDESGFCISRAYGETMNNNRRNAYFFFTLSFISLHLDKLAKQG